MIGINLPCERFKMHKGLMIPLGSRKSLMRDIIFADGKSLCRDGLCNFTVCFSQMNNLVSSHKILVCETVNKCLARKYFRRAYFFPTNHDEEFRIKRDLILHMK